MTPLIRLCQSLVWSACLITAQAALADTEFVASRAALGANDVLDWRTLGNPGDNISPVFFSAQSTGGLTVQGSTLAPIGAPDLGISRQITYSVPGSGDWDGNFAQGDTLLWNSTGAVLTLTFNNFVTATPVRGVGVQIQSGQGYSFQAEIQAFDVNGNILPRADGYTLFGTTQPYDTVGNWSQTGDNSATFIGIRSSHADIARIEIWLLPRAGANSDFAINQLSLLTSPVPEPSAPLLLLGGAWVVGNRLRQSSSRAQI